MEYSKKYSSEELEPRYTLSIAANRSGIPVYTIQQWIRQGLILPFKTNTKRNLFADTDIERLKSIRSLIDEHGLNIAGIKALYALIPCWLIKPCSANDQKVCGAFESVSYPCWEAAEKGPECKHTDCRTCEVYRAPAEAENIKSLLKKLL